MTTENPNALKSQSKSANVDVKSAKEISENPQKEIEKKKVVQKLKKKKPRRRPF